MAPAWTAQAATSLLAPSVPLQVTSAAFDSGAVVYWNHPGDHGVTGFTVTGTPGGTATVGGGVRQATVSGLTNSTAYTFTVHATNSHGSSAESAASGANTPLANLIFGDDFNGPAGPGITGLSPCWQILTRNGDQTNSESQWYRPSQVALDGAGNVTITAVASSITASQYQDSTPGANPPYSGGANLTLAHQSGAIQWAWPGAMATGSGSAQAVSQFTQPGFNFTYGKVQVRAIVPQIAGTFPAGGWPAIWMMGANCAQTNPYDANNVGACSWPNAGSEEIDVAQWPGAGVSLPNAVYIYGAGNNGSPNYPTAPTTPFTAYNTYETDWSAGLVGWALNGSAMASINWTTAVASTPMFLILQTAIRGATALTQPVLTVDWVRVFHN